MTDRGEGILAPKKGGKKPWNSLWPRGRCTASPCHWCSECGCCGHMVLHTLRGWNIYQSSALLSGDGVFMWGKQQSTVQNNKHSLHFTVQERCGCEAGRFWAAKTDAAVFEQMVFTSIYQHSQDLERPSQWYSKPRCTFVGSKTKSSSKTTSWCWIRYQSWGEGGICWGEKILLLDTCLFNGKRIGCKLNRSK